MKFRIVAVAGIALLLQGCGIFGSRTPQPVVDAVSRWVAQQPVPRGKTASLKLPPSLASASIRGGVIVAHLNDGRYCFLLFTEIGWKDNFEGTFACNAPFLPSEIVRDPNYGRDYISINGAGAFDELYVRKLRDDRTADVFFDLN